MTATINASAGGVVLTSDTSGTLALQSGGVTKLSVGASGPSLTSPSILTGLTWPDGLVQSRIGWERYTADVLPSNVASVDFTGIPSSVKAIRLLYDLIPATNGVQLYARFSQSGTFVTSASYSYVTANFGLSGDLSSSGSTAATIWAVNNFGIYSLAGSATAAGVVGYIELPNIQSVKGVRGYAAHQAYNTGNGTPYASQSTGHLIGSPGAIDGIRLLFSGGNIDQGRATLLVLRG